MEQEDRLILEQYKEIAVLNEQHHVVLVQHNGTKNIYVKKELTIYNAEVFRYLQNHPVKGVPMIYALVENEGVLTVIEEYISGQTLKTILENNGRMTEEETVRILTQVCEILLQLHHAAPPIIHRDLKPSNIMITADGSVYLTDWNAAKQNLESKSRDTVLLGTVGYAAPEQYGFGSSDPRADIYSLGILMNEMLTGSTDGSGSVIGRLSKVIQKCTRIDPKDRYSSVEAFLKDLKPRQETKQAVDRSSSFLIPGFRSGNPSNMAAAIIGYLIIFAIAFTITINGAESEFEILANRLTILLIFLFSVFFTFNYRNIWHPFRVDRIKNHFLKTLAILCIDAAVSLGFVIVLILILS